MLSRVLSRVGGHDRARRYRDKRDWKLTANCIQGTLLIRRVQISYSPAHYQTEFDFIMYTDSLGAQNGTLIGYDDGRRWLEEEERLFRLDIVQFGDVVTVMIQWEAKSQFARSPSWT